MKLQPDDFWSFEEWLLRPGKFLESALLQGIVLFVLAIVLGLLVGYIFSAGRHGPSEGFYAMARAIRDLLFRDLPGTSVRRIFALARLAFKEAIRRKVLFVIGLFIVILLFAGWYLNGDSDDPARLYISFVLTATNYLILALALFISAFSLPQDIESRTIYTIVTKPVRATEIVLGRIFGFIAVGTVMLIPMGLASYVFVTRGLNHSHLEVVEAEEVRGGIEGETDFVRRHVHTFNIEDEENVGLSNFVRGHQHVVTQTGESEFSIGTPTGHLRARIPVYGDIQFYGRDGKPKEAGIDVGNERLAGGYGSAGISRLIGVTRGTRKVEHGYVEGGTLGMAEFTFKGVTRDVYKDGIALDMSIRAYRSYKGDIETGIRGSITIRNPDTKAESNPIAFIVDEYAVDERVLDLTMDGTDAEGNLRPGPKNPEPMDVFEELVTEDGRVQILIKCLDRSQYLGVTKSSVYLRPDESSSSATRSKRKP
ncbi:MAG: ABC transporter permease [Planctomycetota bacterium]